jgi:hypothetical protein
MSQRLRVVLAVVIAFTGLSFMGTSLVIERSQTRTERSLIETNRDLRARVERLEQAAAARP